MTGDSLQAAFEKGARLDPGRVAVEDPAGGEITYAEIDRLASRLRDRLHRMGVEPGDRVGLFLPKSIDAIAAIQGILKSGAAYVPVDFEAPVARNAYLLADCGVRLVVVDRRAAAELARRLSAEGSRPVLLEVEMVEPGRRLAGALDALDAAQPAPQSATHESSPDDLAYILYTSGSTGKPKGVALTQRNATSFLDWCDSVFAPRADDRFSSHAPLHFDLSILDVHLAARVGATVVPVPGGIAKDPLRLAPLIAETRISIWYSAPSILALLARYGRLGTFNYSALRMVLFAGEVFPVKHLRRLKELWPAPRYFNLYGPTETNVCTFFEIPEEIPESRDEPYPIGKICSHLEGLVIDESGAAAPAGEQGELCIRGAAVTSGYWNRPQRNAEAFHVDAEGRGWYKTGDIVRLDENGDYLFLGRRDRMVKRRGYRIELGEIEACLGGHPSVHEVGVLAFPDEEQGVRIDAHLGLAGDERPSIISLRSFCAGRLPAYMIPDRFVRREDLPRTSTGKIDYQLLSTEEGA